MATADRIQPAVFLAFARVCGILTIAIPHIFLTPTEATQHWQRDYMRGYDQRGRRHDEHQTRIKIAVFRGTGAGGRE